MRKIDEALLGTDVVVLLKGDGSTMFQHTTAGVNAEEASSVVVGLRRAARQLGDTLGQSRCPAIHVKGGCTVFSCFEVEKDLVLAVFRRMEEAAVDQLDTTESDAAISPVLEEIRVLLQATV
mmetsp:Transcript_18769/g.38185  ORF Transcript_18769/g.38185 Transcript_18769/m.38185 type:complete len:122 (+) Transcript_18769:1-366(+)|eukprot:CAMPEP_0196719726 /NCGR_PEP_ID=MMETSP1091-20130531/2668_1 /TAXON_ID=302021 /ORGANISM="Rhodomonas sp., Strain CCMP768" /LENGTH=121 /DNA_ID=CAMNT_0042060757 /DNA_START=176 /DNA_END=541 /DNA_ORIENTATION=-